MLGRTAFRRVSRAGLFLVPSLERAGEPISNILKRIGTKSNNYSAPSWPRPYTCAAAMALRLVQFEQGGRRRVGVQLENAGSVVDITALNAAIPTDMKSFIEGWDTNILLAQRYTEECTQNSKWDWGRGENKMYTCTVLYDMVMAGQLTSGHVSPVLS